MRNVKAGARILAAIVLACCLARPGMAAGTSRLWATDCLTKVFRSAAPPEDAGGPVVISGAQGEIASGQAVFVTGTALDAATVSVSDLQRRDGAETLPASGVALQWVRYIDVSRNTSGIPEDELVVKAPASIPDPYWEGDTIAVKAHEAQPIWIEVRIPRDAKPGDYEATLTVRGGAEPVTLPMLVHVWAFAIPEERHVSVVNWWRFPHGFAVEPYSEAYWDLLAQSCAFLMEHRQTDVSIGMSLIEEHGDAGQGCTYDTGRLERYAEVCFGAGIRQIQVHSVGKRTGSWSDTTSAVVPVEAQFRRLAALEEVVQRRGWQGRFAVNIADEPFIQHEESYAAVVDQVHETAPSVRCIEAVEGEYFGKLDIYVPKLSHLNLWQPAFDRAKELGSEVWFYTCCHPVGRYPNRFLDQSLLKVRVLHWINYLYDLDGYLHWALDGFDPKDPYTEESTSAKLPLGDRTVTYPGTKGLLGSLRYSAQRDGLEDFEYLWVLEDRLGAIKEQVGEEAFWLDPRQRPL